MGLVGRFTGGLACPESFIDGRAQTQTSTPPQSFPAVDSVLDTNELLEMILIELDMKTLLLAQRVATKWRTNITNSTLLQKKLFFLPASRDELVKLNVVETTALADMAPGNSSAAAAKNSVAQHAPNIWNFGHKAPGQEVVYSREIAVFNPLLLRQVFEGTMLDQLHLRQNSKNWGYTDSSWEKMLLFQPAPSRLDGAVWVKKLLLSWKGNLTLDGRQSAAQLILKAENEAYYRNFPIKKTVIAFRRWGFPENAVLTFLGRAAQHKDLKELNLEAPSA